MPYAELSLSGAARRLEGPLLFLERAVSVGLNSAVEVIGPDHRPRVGRVALVDEDRMVVEVLAVNLADHELGVHPTAGEDATADVRFGNADEFGEGGLGGGAGRAIGEGHDAPGIKRKAGRN